MTKLLGIVFAGLMVLAIAGCELETNSGPDYDLVTVTTTRATTTTTTQPTTTTTIDLDTCETLNADQLKKGAGVDIGDCVVVYAQIWQYDTITGPCEFLARVSATSSFEPTGLDAVLGVDGDVCPFLSEIDEGDSVKAWGQYLGPWNYNTKAGGTNEIPAFFLAEIELISKG